MKMQNAEMEFVTFDAQDVVTTSGGPLTAKFTVSGDLYSGLGNVTGVTYKGNGLWNYNSGNWQKLWVNDTYAYPTDGTTYILTEGVSFYDGFVSDNNVANRSLTLYDVTPGTTADTTLTSLSDIVKWLGDYGKKNQ